MKMPYTKSGKCGDMVWQRNRYGQICYPAFIPVNPRTPAQRAVRGNFGAVSQRWRTLTQPQRDRWIAVAWTIMSKPRLAQCGPLTGCQLFVKINVPRANRGLPQLDLPPTAPGSSSQLPVPYLRCPGKFDQPAIAATLFLRANRLLADPAAAPRRFALLLPAPT